MAASYLFLTFAATGSAQTFTSGSIDYGDGSSNVFSSSDIGPDGKFYALWKDGNFKSPKTNIMPSYKLIRWDSGSWTTLGTIAADAIPGMLVSSEYTMLNDRVSLKVDGQGRYHILLQAELTTPGETIIYGTSTNGTTWTFTNLESDSKATNYSFVEPQLELDQNDRPHVVFRISNIGTGGVASRVYSIRHYAFNGTSWSGETVYSQTGGTGSANEVNQVAYAIDGNGKGHISFVVETNNSGTDGSLAYITNAGGSWSSPQILAAGATSNAACVRDSIAVDSNNKVHIIRRDLAYNIFYHTNKSGSFTNTQINGDLKGTFDLDSLAVNAGGDVLAIHNTRTSDAGANPGVLKYACLFNGASSWQVGTAFTGNNNSAQYTSVEFDNNRVAMILLDHFTDPAGTGGSPSYNTPANPRQLQYTTATIAPPSAVATVTSPTSTGITATSATLGGNVTSDGGATITARGVVISQTSVNSSPQLGGSGVTNLTTTGTTGVFTLNAGSLSGSTAYSFRAYATNASGTAYSSTATFTTLAANSAPVIAGTGGDLTIPEGSQGIKSGTFSDVQGNGTVTISIGSGPGSVTQDNANGTWQWTHTPADGPAGPVQVTIVATDNGTLPLSNSVSFNFSVTNVAPTAVSQSGANAITVLEDSGPTPITLAASDPGGANDTLTFAVGSLTPPSAGVLGGTAPNVTFTPSADFNGNASFTFTASDEDGGTSAPATVQIVVTPVNDAPTLNTISNLTVDRNSGTATVNLSGISSGPANENTQLVSISAVSSDTLLVPNPTVNYSGGSTGTLTFTPAANQTGSATVTVTILDDGGTANAGVNTATRTFTITVRPFSYDAWKEKSFTALELADPAISGRDANPDGDARVNAWEYALGTDPKSFDHPPILGLSLQPGSGATRMADYTYTRDLNATDAVLSLEVGTSSFTTIGSSPVSTSLGGTLESVSHSDDAATGTTATRRARLLLNLASESQTRSSELYGTRAVAITPASGSTPGTTFASAPFPESRFALGAVASVGTSTLTVDANQWPSNLLSAGPAYLILTNGSAQGVTVDLLGYSSGVLSLGDDLSGIATAGDTFEIRFHHTLSGVFDRTNAGFLDSGADATSADNIQYALTDGSFETFFKSTVPGTLGWRGALNSVEDNRIIYPEQSFVIKRKSTAGTTLFQQGVLNTDGGVGNGGQGAAPKVPVATGTNLVTSPADKTVTLADLGLFTGDPATGVTSATTSTNADRIVVPQPNGTMKTYFYHPTLGWVTSSFQPAGTLAFPPGTTFYIIRKDPRPPFEWQTP